MSRSAAAMTWNPDRKAAESNTLSFERYDPKTGFMYLCISTSRRDESGKRRPGQSIDLHIPRQSFLATLSSILTGDEILRMIQWNREAQREIAHKVAVQLLDAITKTLSTDED